ncbi:MAG: hypothetical protein AUJ12_10150 [Alphaproteobacteria bacterium CG1_02_46_17]|nr:MAG: hypothetical protein AUJ12_10150 [Alphaproteobacteria bacterium CG1_02_46_17]
MPALIFAIASRELVAGAVLAVTVAFDVVEPLQTGVGPTTTVPAGAQSAAWEIPALESIAITDKATKYV